jgi:hypothetical protein
VGIIVGLVGGFGAALGFLGSMAALFTGGIGFTTGADEADAFAARAVGAILASLVGAAGALTARSRIRLGAGLLIASAIVGLLFAFWFYVAGAVMLLAAATMALWPGIDSPEPR